MAARAAIHGLRRALDFCRTWITVDVLAARIEYGLRMAGHQGVTSVRRFNLEMDYGAGVVGRPGEHFGKIRW